MIKNQDSFEVPDDCHPDFHPDIEIDDKSLGAFADSELADVFDRYAAALDLGDNETAERILDEYPEIGSEFRVPLRGLYLLGREAQEQKRWPSQTSANAPNRLGDFEIQGELGRGGMGVVYRATQISLQRPVALKILPFTAVLDPRQVTRFRNEAQAAASLHHPHIVPVYAVGCERGIHYYSMQLIEGQTVAEFIEQFQLGRPRHQGLPDPVSPKAETIEGLSTIASHNSKNYVLRVTEIGARVAEAIHFAHENGIVHRDVKPSNLLLDQTAKVWVADFGLARNRETSSLTSNGDQLGTLRYMSPEQAAGRNNEVDFRTDIYSLGVTLAELLTLRPVFEAPGRMELLTAIETSNPIPLRAVNSSIPLDLETVIHKATEGLPGDRYQSAQAFADDLLRCFEGKPIQAKRKTVLDRCAKFIARYRWLAIGAAAALLMVVIIAMGVATVFYQQRQREHAAAEDARMYLQQAHDSVNRFGTLLTDQLAQIPGTADVRGKLLREAIGYYDDFLTFAERSPDLEFEQAQAYTHLAGLYERAGDDEKAFGLYQTASERLAEIENNVEAQVERAICFDRIGLLHKRQGDLKLAAGAFKTALTRFAQLDSSLQTRDDVLVAAAQTQANLGLLCWAQGDLKAAAKEFEQALDRLESDGQRHLSKPKLQSAYFKINGSYVSVLQEGDPERAIATLRASIDSLEAATVELEKLSHDDAVAGSDDLASENTAHAADMRNNLAVILCQQKRFAEAAPLIWRAIEYWESRLKTAPAETLAAERLATVYNTLGEIQYRGRAADQGQQSFAAAQRMLTQVVQRLPNQPETLSRLGGVFHNQSLVARRSGQNEEASRLIKRAIDYQSQAAEISTENVRYQNLLKSHQQASSIFVSSSGGTQ